MTVDVDTDQMEGMKHRAARIIAGQVRIPGFRPGKAPYQVIVRHVGEAALMEEALELLLDDIYPTVLEEAKIEPYGPGKLEKIVSKEPLKLEFVVPMKAEVDLGNYRAQRKPYQPREITEQDIEEAIQNLRENQAVIEPVDRLAQEGDLVTVRLSARRTKEEEGKEPVLIRESSYPIVVYPALSSEDNNIDNKERSPEWPFPGFSQHLVGLSENDEKTLQYSFPDNAPSESMRGAEAEFHLAVVSVKSRKLPELDDEFAASLGDYENLEILRQKVRTALENQAKQTYDESYDEEILKEAINQATFKYPSQMLERELDKVIDEVNDWLEQQKLDLNLYLKTRNLDMEGLRKEMRPIAEERIKHRLFLLELSKAEGIKIEPDELHGEAQNTMKYLSKILPEKEARKLSDKDVYENLVSNVYADMISRRAIERFRDICNGRIEPEEISAESAEVDHSDMSEQNENNLDKPSQSDSEMVVVDNDVTG